MLQNHWLFQDISGSLINFGAVIWSYWQSPEASRNDSHMWPQIFSDHGGWDQFPPICPLFSQPFSQPDMLLEKSVDLAQYSLPWYTSLGGRPPFEGWKQFPTLYAVGHLLRDENNFPLFTAFCVPDDHLPALNVFGGQFQHFTDSHTTPGHEFQHKAISWIFSPENHLVNTFFF